MAIKVNNNEVINDSRNLLNISRFGNSVNSTFANIIRYIDVAGPTPINNRDYIIGRSTGTIDVVLVLPANPVFGNEITIGKDNSTGKVTINNNGKNIMGIEEPLILDIPNTVVRLAYQSSELGWVIL
jgi:hypothetical protein